MLQQLWERSPLSAQDIIERLAVDAPQSTHPKTVKTLINRLLKKGALGYHEQNRKYYYYPIIDRDTYYTQKTESFLDKFYDGEVAPLLSFFAQRRKLNQKDLHELKHLIDKLEAEDDN